MSEVARRWGPETAAPEPSIEDLLEPIALEARLAEARARRTQVLATKSGNPALVVGASPPAAPPALREPSCSSCHLFSSVLRPGRRRSASSG